MKETLNSIWECWKTLTGIGVISIWLMIMVFGGEWNIKITFGTLGELIKTIKRMYL